MSTSHPALLNFVRLSQNVAQKQVVYDHAPTFLEFAQTSACNLKCIMCSQSDDPPVINADRQKSARFLEQVLPSITSWTPSATSEPLLNNLDEMIAHCEQHQVYLDIYTNAVLLHAETFEKLAPWLHRLTLSIDTHVVENLERVRFPLKYDRALEDNLRYALQRSSELEIPCSFHTVMMKDTLPDYAAYVDWVADMGGREITVLEMLDNSSRAQEQQVLEAFELAQVNAILQDMQERARARSVNLHLALPPPFTSGSFINATHPQRLTMAAFVENLQEAHADTTPGFCPQLSHYLKVEPNGDAYPCCRGPRELRLGNVFEQDWDQVWNGPAAQKLRRAHYKNRVPSVCVGCSVRESRLV
jgi:radical SAM protein with 4Fe4S-binding SPASM domain